MQNYTLKEMLGSLRLGLWSGGYIDGVGYLSGVSHSQPSSSGCGVLGISLWYDMMLEPSWNDSEVNISVYDIYAGGFMLYTMSFVSGIDIGAFKRKLIEIVEGQRKKMSWSHTIYKRNMYAIESRYSASHSSLRTGKVGGTRGSKFFGR